MLYLFLIFLLGVTTPIQTAANSRLRLSVGTPLVASLVSFSVGTIFLLIATLIEKGSVGISADTISHLPWWSWLGGLCGLYGLTVNIVIFPKLGSVQTALMPMLGQIVTGMLIDSFGWLRAPFHPFTLLRLTSIILILIGVVMVVHKKVKARKKASGLLFWQILGFSGGAIFAFQPPMNSLLSASLASATHAAFISFLTATVLLLLIVVITPDNRRNTPSIFSLDRPWWTWLGGIIGGTFVTEFAFFAAKTGVGLLLVTSICGMLTMSLLIDKYGWLGATKRSIGIIQYIGLLCVVAGIILLKMNYMKDIIKLNNGVEMPRIGFGVYQIPASQTERCVADALTVGYRSIDTAQCYYNETEVGNAIRKSGIPRDEIFVTTKLWGGSRYSDTVRSIDSSLKHLGMDHIDLLLIHEPSGDYKEIYRAMEDTLKEGKLRSIGVANFIDDTLVDLVENCNITPAVDQIETHPFRQQREMQLLCDGYGITLEAWSPLACGKKDIFQNPVLTSIAQAHGKTVAQVVLRWLYQRNIVIIPKSTHRERMVENLDILDFSLSQEETSLIATLDEGKSLFNWW